MKKPHHLAEQDYIIKDNNDNAVILPRGLNIVWGDDGRYWSLPAKENREAPATLIQVSWLDVSGSVEVKSGNRYAVSFEVNLKPDAFGWTGSPVLVMAKLGKKGNYKYEEVSLGNLAGNKIPDDSHRVIVDVPPRSPEARIYFGLYEVWSGKWKGGLQIYKVHVDCLGPIQ